jgi:hypothetical protein
MCRRHGVAVNEPPTVSAEHPSTAKPARARPANPVEEIWSSHALEPPALPTEDTQTGLMVVLAQNSCSAVALLKAA